MGFSIIIIGICSSSCAHYYYAPNSNNIPMLKEKNDCKVQAAYSSGNYFEGIEVQSAYAVSNHIGIQLNFFTAWDNYEEYGKGTGTYAEAAGGYFLPTTNKKWVFETYAGIGSGVVNNTYENLSQTSKVGVTKIFLQPSFGFNYKNFELAVASKFSLANFKIKNSTVTKQDNSYDFDDLQMLRDKSYFFWEPGVVLRAGGKYCRFQGSFTWSIPSNSNLSIDNANLSVGVAIPFNASKKAR